jgi:ADP-ribose pyrophosphatase YjhB (NUDIX family)
LEVVVLKDNGGELEVLLTQRTVNDSSFPNMWHVPGTVIRPGETLDVSLKRLAQTELGVEIESYEIAGLINNLKEPRGHFISPILLVKLRQSPKVGKWQNVKNLDEL